jgi:hypothetical protein
MGQNGILLKSRLVSLQNLSVMLLQPVGIRPDILGSQFAQELESRALSSRQYIAPIGLKDSRPE